MSEAVVVGLGARPDPAAETIMEAVREVVGHSTIRCLATIDRRADEPGTVAAAAAFGVPVIGFGADELARVDVPHPGHRAAVAIGTPSVAEAAALLAWRRWGRRGRLIVPKTVFGTIAVAVAEQE